MKQKNCKNGTCIYDDLNFQLSMEQTLSISRKAKEEKDYGKSY